MSEEKTLQVKVERKDSITAEMVSERWNIPCAITSKQPVDAPTPTLMLLGALATCMIAGIEREAQANGLQIDDVQVEAEGIRVPPPQPHLKDIIVHVTLVSPEEEARLRPLLEGLKTGGTVTNTLRQSMEIAITYEIRNSAP